MSLKQIFSRVIAGSFVVFSLSGCDANDNDASEKPSVRQDFRAYGNKIVELSLDERGRLNPCPAGPGVIEALSSPYDVTATLPDPPGIAGQENGNIVVSTQNHLLTVTADKNLQHSFEVKSTWRHPKLILPIGFVYRFVDEDGSVIAQAKSSFDWRCTDGWMQLQKFPEWEVRGDITKSYGFCADIAPPPAPSAGLDLVKCALLPAQ